MKRSNLQKAMDEKGISIQAIASVTGEHRNTISNKIHGRTEFTIGEALRIKEALFPEYDLNYLFKKVEQDAATPCSVGRVI